MKSVSVLGSICVSLLFLVSVTSVAQAGYTPPTQNVNFGDCRSPWGKLTVSYTSGWHWIVGNNVLQWGSDKVFNLGYDNYLQCYCPVKEEGKASLERGMQTNWLYAQNLSAAQIQNKVSNGWILVQNGVDFGLKEGKYLAKNIKYDCPKTGSSTCN